MSELAFNVNGEEFEVPVNVTGWRVRRMKPRGAPELVYGKDGKPLSISIESDMDDLRNAVGYLGRYRLDPIDEEGKVVEEVPAAYVHVVRPERDQEATGTTQLAPRAESDSVVKEAMRLNTELAKSVVDRFPEMMHAAAEILRAADGAGLPARQPRAIESSPEEEDSDDAPQVAPGFELINNLIAQVVPVIITGLANKGMPKLGEIVDWRKAAPKRIATSTTKERASTESANEAPPAAAAPEQAPTQELPALDPATMVHFIAIQSALKPEEAALAREVASGLSPAEMHSWIDELSKLSVPQAVQKIRVLIAGNTEAVS